MQIDLKPGKYVVAVSGGVDSVVLLDLLSKKPRIELVVAHFDHGIRPDSSHDRQLVETLSQKYGLPTEIGEGKLGKGASEAQAREARYEFLRQIRDKHQAIGVVTAHHLDDAVETLAFNTLRGTKRKGVSALQSQAVIIRPLLPYSKTDLRNYAHKHGLRWREDSTNTDEKYTRNWIRHRLLPKLSRRQKRELTEAYHRSAARNRLIDEAIGTAMREVSNHKGLNRKKFIALPYPVACEIMAAWLGRHKVQEVDRKLIDIAVVSAKTLPPGKKISLDRKRSLKIEADSITIDSSV